MGPRFVLFAALFYGLLAAAAALWAALGGFDLPLLGVSPLLGALFGFVAAGATVGLGLLAYRLLPVMRQVADELGPRLVDGADRGSLILVSVFSGVGEETFFRGAVQHEFGLVVASLIFGVVHVGPDRRYLLWTIWAVLAGFLFGIMYDFTGGLLAPILAHTTHNAVTLLLWKRSREKAGSDDPREPAGP